MDQAMTRSQEDARRRKAQRTGLRLEKSRVRNTHSNNRAGYQLIVTYSNTVLGGSRLRPDEHR